MPHPDHTRNDPTGEEIVLGVDTHKDIHVAAVVTTLGAHLAAATFPTTDAGYRQLVAWARSFGVVVRAGVEGTGSYGAALTRHLRRDGVVVIEVNRPDRAARRHGTTDTVDAVAAAGPSWFSGAIAVAKTTDGPVEILRLLRLTRNSAVTARTQAINQLKAVIVSKEWPERHVPQIARERAAGRQRIPQVGDARGQPDRRRDDHQRVPDPRGCQPRPDRDAPGRGQAGQTKPRPENIRGYALHPAHRNLGMVRSQHTRHIGRAGLRT